jgi:parvulin-like peptidyl-prolyl isomerase
MQKSAHLGVFAAAVATVVLSALAAGPLARAEIIEEIAVRVNDEVIVRSEMQARRASISRQIQAEVPPDQLEEILAQAQESVLFDMINEELLVQQAHLSFDMEKYFDNLKKDFMLKNEIKTETELADLLAKEGLTLVEFRRLLIRSNVPQDMLQFDVARKLVVSPAEVQAYYDDHRDEFRSQGEVMLQEIVILTEGRGTPAAQAIVDDIVIRVAAGEEFGALAVELSESPSKENGGSIGPFMKGDLAPVLEAQAFTLAVGQVGEPIATSYGFHLLMVESRNEAVVAPLSEVKDDVDQTLRQKKYAEDLDTYLLKLWTENQVVVNPRYVSGKLADGGPYASLDEILSGEHPLGPPPDLKEAMEDDGKSADPAAAEATNSEATDTGSPMPTDAPATVAEPAASGSNPTPVADPAGEEDSPTPAVDSAGAVDNPTPAADPAAAEDDPTPTADPEAADENASDDSPDPPTPPQESPQP